jgi:hypothetical protein
MVEEDDRVMATKGTRMIDDGTRDRAEIYDLFTKYADAVTGRQWNVLNEVFTEDVTGTWPGSPDLAGRTAVVRRIRDMIERTAETHLLGNYSATIDGDVAEASVRIRVYQLCAGAPARLCEKIVGSFRAKLVRTGKGWRFRHLGAAHYATVGVQEALALA